MSTGYPFNIRLQVEVTGSQSAQTYFRRPSSRREFALYIYSIQPLVFVSFVPILLHMS